jgi:hypothetical protein
MEYATVIPLELQNFQESGGDNEADLSSKAAQKVHRELLALGLPTLNDIKGDFKKLARELGVKR